MNIIVNFSSSVGSMCLPAGVSINVKANVEEVPSGLDVDIISATWSDSGEALVDDELDCDPCGYGKSVCELIRDEARAIGARELYGDEA